MQVSVVLEFGRPNGKHLKLAVSTQKPAIFTTHLADSAVPAFPSPAIGHGRVRPGSRTPLSLANCSRQMGRKRPSEQVAKTSLESSHPLGRPEEQVVR